MRSGTLENAKDLDAIRRVVFQIVDVFHPRQVILFGSRARGDITSDSDVDLLVIMDTHESPLHSAAAIAAAIDHPFPLDIIVMTSSSWEAALGRKAIFVSEVAREGVSLYEA